MDNITISYLCRNDPFIAPYFWGVYSSDALPVNKILKLVDGNNPTTAICFVVNTHPLGNDGHWVAVYLTMSGILGIFDGIGIQDYPDPLKYLIKNFTGHLVANRGLRFQASFSRACRFYALYFLYKRCRGATFFSICKTFSRVNFIQNDLFVKNVILHAMLI